MGLRTVVVNRDVSRSRGHQYQTWVLELFGITVTELSNSVYLLKESTIPS